MCFTISLFDFYLHKWKETGCIPDGRVPQMPQYIWVKIYIYTHTHTHTQENNIRKQEIQIKLKKCITQEALDVNSKETVLKLWSFSKVWDGMTL